MLSGFWISARRWTCAVALVAIGIGSAAALPGAKFGDAALVTPTSAQTFYNNLPATRSPELLDGRAEQRLRALARALEYDPELIFQFVRNNIEVHPVFGVSKGAYGAFLDMEGTSFDQVDLAAFLLADAVTSGGRTISYQKRVGTITLTPTQWQNWSGLTSAERTCYFLANAGVPALVNGASTCTGLSGNVSSLQIGHAWLEVSVNGGAVQIWDPAFKTTQMGAVNAFGTQAGYTAGAAASAVGGTSGTENGIPYLVNVNTNALKTLLSQRASDLATALTNPANAIYDKRLSDVTGGVRINITESEKLAKAPLAYSAWTGSYTQFPDKFRIKIQIQLRSAATWIFGTSGVTVFADQVYGRPFAIETRAPIGTGGPNSQTCANLLAATPSVATNLWDIEKKFCLMLRVGDRYIAAHQGTNLVTENQHNLSISIDHPYAAPATSGGTSGTYMDDSLYEFVKLASDLVILNSWGNTTEALLADLGDNLGVDLRQAGVLDPRGPSEELYFEVANSGIQGPSNNYVRHRLGATWLAEFTRFTELIGGLSGWKPVVHRNFGIVRSDVFLRSPTQVSTYPPPEVPQFGDAMFWAIGDETIFLDVRPAISVDGTPSQTQSVRKSVSTGAAGLESAVFAHVMGAVDTHSTATKFDYAAKTATEAARTEPGGYAGPYRFYYFGVGSDCNAITKLADASADRTLIHPTLCLAVQEGKSVVVPGATSLGPGPRLASLVGVTYVQSPAGACGMMASYTYFAGTLPPGPIPAPGRPGPGGYSGFPDLEVYPNYGSGITTCQSEANALRLYRPHPNRGGALVAWDASGQVTSHVITSQVGIIKGGGVDVTPGTIKPDALPTADEILAEDVNAARAYSVDLQSGRLTYGTGPLLSVGSGAGALSFERTFRSGSRGALEPVWSHNWNIHAGISSSGLEALGASRADNAVPSLVAAIALLDVYSNTSSAASDIIKREVAGPLIMAWWQDQTTNNAITINQGAAAKTFVRKPNGEYNGPAGSSMRITTTGAPRIVERKFQYYTAQEYVASGASFEWKYDQLSFTLQDASNSSTQFAYRENGALNPWDGEMRTDRIDNWGRPAFWLPTQTTNASGSSVTFNLQGTENGVKSGTVTNSFGRTLTFNETSAADGTGATIQFNNTQVTLPDGKLIRYEFGSIKAKEGQTHPGTYDAQFNYTAADFEKNEHTGYAFIGLTKVYEPGTTPGTDPAVLTVAYDNDNAVASISNALGQSYTYYAAGGRRGAMKDPLAAVSSIQYDDRANAIRSTSAQGVIAESIYDGIGRTLDARTRYASTPAGMYYVRSTYTYDAASNVIEEQMHAGTKDFVTGQTWFDYDPVNYKPLVVKRTFNTAFNVPLTETESHYLGTASPTVLATNTYSATTGLPQSTAGPSGELVTYQWTTGGQLSSKTVKLTAAASTTTDYLYWPTGELKSIKQDSGGLNVLAQFAYNTRGDLTSATDPRNNASTATYDIAHRMLTMRDAVGGGQDIVYDTRGRVQQLKTLKEGGAFAISSVTYTPTNRPATTTDPLGHVTTFTYDGKDRLLQVTDPDSLKVRYDYWADDRVWKITKGVGTPLEQIDAQYWYNWAGAIERHRPGRGTVPDPDHTQYDVQFLFDPYGRQNVTVYPDSTNDIMSINADGTLYQKRTRNVNSPAGGEHNNIRYEYDASNRLIRKYERHEARTPLIRNEVKFEYDLASRITREYELGSDGVYNAGTDEEVLRVWDKLNRLTSETQNGRAVSYTYDAASNRTQITWPDALSANYAFDPGNRLSSVNFNGVALASYGYDLRSRRTSDAYGNGRSASYGYNDDSLLTSLTHNLLNEAGNAENVAFIFGYSDDARLASRNVSHAAYSLALTQTEQRSYTAVSPSGQSADVADRYQSIAAVINGGTPQTTSLTWDPRSNLLSDGARTFAHDFENRLESVTPTSGSTVAYDYDPTGRRVGKTVGATETRFLLAGNEEIAEYSSAGTLLRRYVPGAGVDDRIAWLEGTGTSDIRWFHAERLGSVFATTGANGRITQRHAYDPFGRETPGASQTGNPWRYTGRRLDPETGLYFYRARYYDQANGRFIETDPIGYKDQLNLFAYVDNDPLNDSDPTGMCGDIWWCGYDGVDPATGRRVIQSPGWIRWFPGQVAYDNTRTSIANGEWGAAAIHGLTLALEEVATLMGGGPLVAEKQLAQQSVTTVGTAARVAAGDAAESWFVRTGSNPVVTLGKNDAYQPLARQLGGSYLEVPSAVWTSMSPAVQEATLFKFLDVVATFRVNVQLTGPLTSFTTNSWTYREVRYLIETKGYTLSDDGLRLTAPKQLPAPPK